MWIWARLKRYLKFIVWINTLKIELIWKGFYSLSYSGLFFDLTIMSFEMFHSDFKIFWLRSIKNSELWMSIIKKSSFEKSLRPFVRN